MINIKEWGEWYFLHTDDGKDYYTGIDASSMIDIVISLIFDSNGYKEALREKDRLLLTLIALKDTNSICRKRDQMIQFKSNGISYTPIYGDMNVYYDGYVLLSFDFLPNGDIWYATVSVHHGCDIPYQFSIQYFSEDSKYFFFIK